MTDNYPSNRYEIMEILYTFTGMYSQSDYGDTEFAKKCFKTLETVENKFENDADKDEIFVDLEIIRLELTYIQNEDAGKILHLLELAGRTISTKHDNVWHKSVKKVRLNKKTG